MSMVLLDRVLRRLVDKGRLTVVDHRARTYGYGDGDPDYPDVAIRFTDARVPFDILRSPELGVAEAFMDGRLVIDRGDILDFLTLAQKNGRWERARDIEEGGSVRHLIDMLLRPLRQRNRRQSSRRNVAHHYDLDAGLYDLFLDADHQYSCAYFARDDMSLDEAQEAKLAHIAAKLALRPGQRVLDIGCGWGGMALYLNRHFGVEVLGITLSREQLARARARAEAAGVTGAVRFELIDYRDLLAIDGRRFDRIVSVGMFEHVGRPNFRAFFRHCHNLLTPDGVMLLHTIGRSDGPNTTDAFTRKYIFPGGYIPAMSEVLAAIELNHLMVSDIEVLRLHYARTLRHWYARTTANRDRIEALYDARFYRMWTFYLAGAIGGFEHRPLVNFQIQLIRDRHALPLTRDYMLAAD